MKLVPEKLWWVSLHYKKIFLAAFVIGLIINCRRKNIDDSNGLSLYTLTHQVSDIEIWWGGFHPGYQNKYQFNRENGTLILSMYRQYQDPERSTLQKTLNESEIEKLESTVDGMEILPLQSMESVACPSSAAPLLHFSSIENEGRKNAYISVDLLCEGSSYDEISGIIKEEEAQVIKDLFSSYLQPTSNN